VNFLDYQYGTAETAIYPGHGDIDSYEGLSYVTMGLGGEAGEILNKVKKIARDNSGVITSEHRDKLADELGDVMYYVSQVATQLGFKLEEICRANQRKLLDRMERGVLQGSGDNR
jgi:NTP pyrophosphatase (non-canonical NTP hydrolase)